MGTAGPLLQARFIRRPNRFLVEARLARSHRMVLAHLADPGRLGELLVEGALLRLRPAPDTTVRKTRFSAVLVQSPVAPRPWVSLDTTLANRLAADLIAAGRLQAVGPGWTVQREVRYGASRLDFKLTRPHQPGLFIEVKSVSLVCDGVGLFPDAPTARGTRHLRELKRFQETAGRSMVLFVVQRHDACRVEPNRWRDPAFAAALESAAEAGVSLRAVKFRLEASGRAHYAGPLPVKLKPEQQSLT